jgi:hypothetical protein
MGILMVLIVVVVAMNGDYQKKKVEAEKQVVVEQLKVCQEKCVK